MGDDVEVIRRELPSLKRYIEQEANNRCTDLSKESGELRGSNPWHGSSTGNNFAVDPDNDRWFCHSKGHKQGGGIFEFIAVDEGLVDCGHTKDISTVFPEVLEIAAEKAGVDLDMDAHDKAKAKQRREKRQQLDDLYEEATAFYHEQLDVAVPTPDGDDVTTVRQWITDKYGLDDDTINTAMVGFAPNKDTALIDAVSADQKLLLESGLAISTQGGVVDFFDGRVMFPYFERGKPRYFIGRQTPITPDHDWERAKYKKVPRPDGNEHVSELIEEPIYGRDGVRDAEHVIITEGVTDVLAAKQYGYTAIAPVTTSFKQDKVYDVAQLVRGKDVTVIMDEDAETQAGIQGSLKTAKCLEKRTGPATNVRVARLPIEDGDICDYLRDQGGRQEVAP